MDEFHSCLRLETDGAIAVNDAYDLLGLLLQLLGLRVEVFGNCRRVVEGAEGGDVVERCILGQQAWVWRGQKRLINARERHGSR